MSLAIEPVIGERFYDTSIEKERLKEYLMVQCWNQYALD